MAGVDFTCCLVGVGFACYCCCCCYYYLGYSVDEAGALIVISIASVFNRAVSVSIASF